MREWLLRLADRIAGGPGSELATTALGGIPGLPPVLQTLHLLAAAVLMGSAVLFLMRVNGLVMNHVAPGELGRNLLPWAAGALLVLPLVMTPFLFARPHRYLLNPVFGIKMGLLLAALLMTMAVVRGIQRMKSSTAAGLLTRTMALPALLTWLLVLLAGRWIAYSDYLFWPA